jgi:hypothetical protein
MSTWKPITRIDINGGLPVREGLLLSEGDSPLFVPFVSSQPLVNAVPGGRASKVKRAVIMAQPYSGEPMSLSQIYTMFCSFMSQVIYNQGALDGTLFIAILLPEDNYENLTLASGAWDPNTLPEDATMDYWASAGDYTNGADSVRGKFSSFEVFDRLVELVQSRTMDAFPNLDTITLWGYSGGCKFLSRWAFFSETLVQEAGKAKVQVVGGGCNNFMYFDRYRPSAACTPNESIGEHSPCDSFYSASKASTDCDKYDHYPYGFGYVPSKYGYLRRILEQDERLEELKWSFANKSVAFLVGSWDDCNCKAGREGTFTNGPFCYHPQPHCNDCFPDAPYGVDVEVVGGSCAKELTGRTRLQRLSIWGGYLADFYNRTYGISYKLASAKYVGGHDIQAFYGMPLFIEMTLGNPQHR